MIESENKAIARQFYERAWNESDLSVIDELLAPHFLNHDIEGPTAQSHRDLYKKAILDTYRAFPDWTLVIDDLIAEGEKVVLVWRAQGTHMGEGMGTPTGKQINMDGITIVRIVAGKITEFWKKG